MWIPTVSVIIATHNRAEYLKDTIDSVLNQTFSDLELIIINDGSTDSTEEVVDYYNDERIRYYYQENLGQNGAKNAGLLKAKGKYISILDSDDIWLPTKLEKQVDIFEQFSDVGLVYSGTLVIDEKGQIIGKKPLLSYNGYVLDKLLMTNFIYNGSNALYRKECIDDFGIFDPEITSMTDWGLYLKFALKYKFYCVDEYLLKYRVHTANMSCDLTKYLKSGFTILDKIFNHKDFDPKYLKYKGKAYGLRYKYVGRRYFEDGNYKESREYLTEALKSAPSLALQSDTLMLLTFSYFPQNIVRNLRSVRQKIKIF